MIKKLLVLIHAMLHICYTYINAQVTISGNVWGMGKWLHNARISINNLHNTYTDKQGFYEIKVPADSLYIIRCEHDLYETITDTIKSTSNLIKHNIELYVQLNEVVVSSTLKEVLKTESPIWVEVYNEKFFKRNPVPSLFENLQTINGVRPQINCGVCSTGDIHLNGMEGPYTMVLIDGMPIVSGLATVYGLFGIPSGLIERIEIIKGPASTLYGSEAVAGVINVITKNKLNTPQFGINIFANNHTEINTDILSNYSLNKQLNLITGLNIYTNPIAIDNNEDNFTDIPVQQRYSLFNKLMFNKNNKSYHSLAFRYIHEDRWGGEMQFNKQFRGGDSVYGESIITKRYEIIGNSEIRSSKNNYKLMYSFSSHKQDAAYGENIFLADQKIFFIQPYTNFTIKNTDLLVGCSYRFNYYDDNTPATADQNGNNNMPSVTHLPGCFIQAESKLSHQHKLLYGIRNDYNSTHGFVFSPRLAYKYTPNIKNTFRISSGNGYRIVNLFTEEHAALTGARKVMIAEKLKPEQSWNINAVYTRNIYLKKTYLSIDLSVFHTHFSNKIIPDYNTYDTAIIYKNLMGYAINRGASLSTELNYANNIKIIGGLIFMDVNVYNETPQGLIKERQLLTERFSGVLNFSYYLQAINLSIDYTANIYAPMRLPLQENDFRPEYSPWYSIQNVQITKKFKSKIEVFAGIKNLLNFTPPAYSIMRAHDPFNKQAHNLQDNPFGYSFDTSYIYTSFQGRRYFLGIRYNLHK
jgi:outer membrane receptor for ferrienterochelin and colicins